MGSSPTATIFWGLMIEDSTDGDDYEDRYATAKGWDGEDYSAQRKILDECPVDIVTDGSLSDGVGSYYVGHKESFVSGGWDEPTEVDVSKFAVRPHWEKELREYCELMEIPWKEPKLLMVCSYG